MVIRVCGCVIRAWLGVLVLVLGVGLVGGVMVVVLVVLVVVVVVVVEVVGVGGEGVGWRLGGAAPISKAPFDAIL